MRISKTFLSLFGRLQKAVSFSLAGSIVIRGNEIGLCISAGVEKIQSEEMQWSAAVCNENTFSVNGPFVDFFKFNNINLTISLKDKSCPTKNSNAKNGD